MSRGGNRADLPQFYVCKQTAYESIETAPRAAWGWAAHKMPSHSFYTAASFHMLGYFDTFTSSSFLFRRWEDAEEEKSSILTGLSLEHVSVHEMLQRQ